MVTAVQALIFHPGSSTEHTAVPLKENPPGNSLWPFLGCLFKSDPKPTGESWLSPKKLGDRLHRIYSCGSLTVTHRGEKSPGATLEIWVVVLNIFHVYPYLGKMNPFWRAYFSKGLVQPRTRNWLPGHLLANRQYGTRHWELWLCRCQSGKPGE